LRGATVRPAAFFLLLAALIGWQGSPAAADLSKGLRAYDAGDYDTTYAEWRALADQGDIEAQTALAGLYIGGLGVEADARQAATWYRRAAERGHLVAQMNLGDMYARGVGVERDPVQAFYWLDLAAEQGRRWAIKRRDAIAVAMTAEQRAAAEKLLAARRAQR
jgi:TPR repeat protein